MTFCKGEPKKMLKRGSQGKEKSMDKQQDRGSDVYAFGGKMSCTFNN